MSWPSSSSSRSPTRSPDAGRDASSSSRATVAPLRQIDLGNVGPESSPLEQLGRLAGTARKGSLGAGSSSEASTSTIRPQQTTLVFNSFRNSTASDSSTFYTSSIYSNSEDNHAYWEGRRPTDDDESDEDDAKTERGDGEERDELEEVYEDDEASTVDGHGGEGNQGGYYESVGLRPDGGASDFTTSSRISRMLDSTHGDDSQVPDASVSSAWSASSPYSTSSSPETYSELLPPSTQSIFDPTYTPPPPSSPRPSPSLIRTPSIGGVAQRRTEVVRPQIEITSIYGDEGTQWGGEGGEHRSVAPPRTAELTRGGASLLSQPGSSNFSRPIKVSTTAQSSGLAIAAQVWAVGGTADFFEPPKRTTSLRRKAEPELSRSSSPPTPTFDRQRQSLEPIPFPPSASPSPPPNAVASLSFSPRLPTNLRQQSAPSTPFPQQPNPTSPTSPTTPYGPPRPMFAANAYGSTSSITSITSLPTRRAPAPPVDRPAFNGRGGSEQTTVRLVPLATHPHRPAHPSNGATSWSPSVPPSSSISVQLPTRQPSYPPPPALPLQPQGLYLSSEPNSQRTRAYSESEQNETSRPGLLPLTGTTSGPPSFATTSPKPSFKVTSRDRSESSASLVSYPLNQMSNSSLISSKSLTSSISSQQQLRLSPTSRAELHPGLFSFYELGPASRSASPTRESFFPPKGSYTKVEIVENQPSSSTTSSPSPLARTASSTTPSEPPKVRMGAEQYLKLGIQHHASHTDLALAAMYFKEAATVDGGCPGGMLFWGLTLRSGWGVVKDEKKGFEWLRRACEPRPLSGESGASGTPGGSTEPAALAPEMVVAILEVAQCFLHGWGCLKDPEKAVNYLLVAAKMGDVDAQLQLASCYLHGLGTKGKKDKIKSAFWFRAALAQGASDAGLSWVFKKKYMGLA